MTTSGVGLGVSSLVIAFRRLVFTPTLWPYALLPSVVLCGVMSLVLIYGASPLIGQALARTGLTNLDTWYGQAGELLLSMLLWLTSALVAVWAAMVVTPPLCAPALEHLVRAEEKKLGAPPRLKLSIVFELLCGVRSQLLGLAFSLCVWVVLTILEFVAPVLVWITMPLKVVAVAAALAWSLLDYPLTLRGVRARQRLLLFRAQPMAVVGFGLPFSFLFWFPCTSVLLLPVGAMAATRVVWLLAQKDERWHLALTSQEGQQVDGLRS